MFPAISCAGGPSSARTRVMAIERQEVAEGDQEGIERHAEAPGNRGPWESVEQAADVQLGVVVPDHESRHKRVVEVQPVQDVDAAAEEEAVPQRLVAEELHRPA